MRVLDARIYPARRPDAVPAPRRVDARIKSAHDVKGSGKTRNAARLAPG
jgi:hypothetical protein